jgi:hypothetical protein
MDPNKDLELEKLLAQASASALKSLDAMVDVDQMLSVLYREVGLESEAEQDNIQTPGNAHHANAEGSFCQAACCRPGLISVTF